MPIYERPTKTLMREFADERLSLGHTFRKNEAVRWFAERYPKIKAATVRMHVDGMSTNNLAHRKHHQHVKPGSGHDLFFKIGPDQYRLYQSDTDPRPLYRDDAAATDGSDEDADEGDDAAVAGEVNPSGSREFAFERDLRNYLVRNLGLIERGLRLYEEEEITGVEFPVGGRFIDILAVDSRDNFVVIELKVSRGYDRTIWPAAGSVDTGFRCHDGTGGYGWDDGSSAASSSSRR